MLVQPGFVIPLSMHRLICYVTISVTYLVKKKPMLGVSIFAGIRPMGYRHGLFIYIPSRTI